MKIRVSKPVPVGVISKVLQIFELLDQFPSGLELKDVAAKTGINKSTAYRFLSHLESECYLLRDETGAFMLGPKLTRLGGGVSFETTLCRICRPTLDNLQHVTSETVNLAVLDGASTVLLDVIESPHRFKLASEVGTRGSVHCTALGKAILASMSEGHRKEEILASIRFEAYTPHTIMNMARFKKQLALTRERGFALDDEEVISGVRCIGAAVFGSDGEIVAAISISGPTGRITKERLPDYSAQVCKAAQNISRSLGYRPPKQ